MRKLPLIGIAALLIAASSPANAQSSGPGGGSSAFGGGLTGGFRSGGGMSPQAFRYRRAVLVPGDYQRMHGCGSSWEICKARARATPSTRRIPR